MQPFVGLVPWPVFSSFLPSATCTATPFAPCSALAILHVSLSLIFDNVSRVLLLPNPPPSHFLLENNKKSHPKVIYLPVLFSFFSLFFWQEKSKSPNKESTVFAVEAFLIWRIKSAWMRTCCNPQSSIIIIVLFKRKSKKKKSTWLACYTLPPLPSLRQCFPPSSFADYKVLFFSFPSSINTKKERIFPSLTIAPKKSNIHFQWFSLFSTKNIRKRVHISLTASPPYVNS